MLSAPCLPSLALLALTLLSSAEALILPATAQLRRGPDGLRRRNAQTGELTLNNEYDVEYVTQLSVGGATFTVMLDTGSSDLSIIGSVPDAEDTNIPIPVTFAVGELDGVLSFADVEFAGYTVNAQIFNHVSQSQNQGSDEGTLGLGPSYASVLWNTAQPYIQAGQLGSNAGDSVVDRIFQANPNTGNSVAFYMERNDDPSSGTVGQGYFTIGEVLTSYKSILNMPKLPVVGATNMGEQHFAVVIDGVVGNNGQQVALPQSAVTGVPAGKMVAIFDTGYSFPQVPAAIANAFYSTVAGAQQSQMSDGSVFWTMPCTTPVNGAFIIGGNTYPIHPLDLNFDAHFMYSDLPADTCLGAFQPMTEAAASALDGQADMILGMAFLRNVYSLFNYGDWIDSSMDSQYAPFVELLSITDPSTAASEFQQSRNGGGSSSGHLSSNMKDLSTQDVLNGLNTAANWMKTHLYIVIPAAVGVLIVIGLLIMWCCICCRRKRARATRYQTLAAPAPGHAPYGTPQYYGYSQGSPYEKKGFEMGPGQTVMTPAPPYDDPYSPHHQRGMSRTPLLDNQGQ